MTEIIIVNESPDIIEVHVQDPTDVVCFDFAQPNFWVPVNRADKTGPGHRRFPTNNDANYVALVQLESGSNSSLFIDGLKANDVVLIRKGENFVFSVLGP